MFWGLVLEPSKKYTQKVDQTFHISQAALDLKSCDQEPIQLVVEYENSNFVLATLSRKANIFQVPLDLIFKTGDEISFRTIGNGKVHLSGYHVLEDLDSVLMNGEEESDLDEVEEIIKGKGKRKKSTPMSKGGKKAKLDEGNEDESDDDDFEEDLDDEDDDSEEENQQIIAAEKKANKKKSKNDSSILTAEDFEDDEEEEEEDDDDDDDEDEEEEDDDDDLDLNEEDDESDMDEVEEHSGLLELEKDKKSKKKIPQTPNGLTPDTKGKNQSPQKQNKNLKQGGKEMKTPKSETKQKGEKKPGSAESTPQRKNPESAKKEAKTPKTPKSPKPQNSENSPQKKVLEGGVISEEIRVGNGPVAKPGKMVNVYYVGTLASTKKEFDSVQGGGGFKFRLGRNEVIKGWDIGVVGMKVGGKRKLTIPPHLAYGSKGSPPVIPPNSTLVFTVELKSLS